MVLTLTEKTIDKERLRIQALHRLEADYKLQLQGAKRAHAAATHEENVPDNKYATLGLEASYLAQGQANRAQEILQAQQQFRQLNLANFSADSTIRLTAVVELVDDRGTRRQIFLVPTAGGLLLNVDDVEIMLITPASPLGRELIGRECGDVVTLTSGTTGREYEIVSIC